MRIDDDRREEIKKRQENIKESAIDEVYEDLQSIQHKKIEVKNNQNDIWGEDDIKDLDDKVEELKENVPEPAPPKEIPSVRNPEITTATLSFTEKLLPGVAARDRYIKEAPLPVLKRKMKQQGIEGDFQNPFWMKDKGDNFIASGDYLSAINAFDSALQLDAKMLSSVCNRAICYFKLFQLEDCITDCELVSKLYNELPDEHKEKPENKEIALKSNIRRALCLSLLGKLEESKSLLVEIRQTPDLSDQIKLGLEQDIGLIDQRIDLLQRKTVADTLYLNKEYAQAKASYLELLTDDPSNERVIGNLSLVSFKLGEYKESISYSSKAIEIVESFIDDGLRQTKKIDLFLKKFYLKLIIRRATCYYHLEKLEECKKDIKSVVLIDELNQSARDLLRRMEAQETLDTCKTLKEEGDSLIRSGDFQGSILKYEHALRIVNPVESPIEFLGLILNSTVALLNLEKYEDVISKSIQGLRLIGRLTNSLVKIRSKDLCEGMTELTLDERKKIKDYEIRLLIRRGNAYLKKGQIFHAKSDFQDSLKLDPDNKEVSQVLAKIQSAN